MTNQVLFSQLINGKSRDIQKLLKYFNGKTTSAFNLFSFSDVLPIIFVLYLKDLPVSTPADDDLH